MKRRIAPGPRSRASIFRVFPLPDPDRNRVVARGCSLEGGSLPRQLKTQCGRKRNAVTFSPVRLAARPNRWTRSARDELMRKFQCTTISTPGISKPMPNEFVAIIMRMGKSGWLNIAYSLFWSCNCVGVKRRGNISRNLCI